MFRTLAMPISIPLLVVLLSGKQQQPQMTKPPSTQILKVILPHKNPFAVVELSGVKETWTVRGQKAM